MKGDPARSIPRVMGNLVYACTRYTAPCALHTLTHTAERAVDSLVLPIYSECASLAPARRSVVTTLPLLLQQAAG